MTDQIERQLRDLFAEEATRAPQATSMAADVVHRMRRRHVAWASGASVVVVVLAVVIGGGQFGGQRDRPPASSPANTRTDTPTTVATGTTRRGALPDGAAASCVARYSATTLARQAFAFDGTVAAIGPARTNRDGAGESPLVATAFVVHEWFRGGSGTTVTIDMTPPRGGTEDSIPSYDLGTRLLVSGQPRWGGAPLTDAIGWGCGFTRYYDPATAGTWRTVFR